MNKGFVLLTCRYTPASRGDCSSRGARVGDGGTCRVQALVQKAGRPTWFGLLL